MTGVDPSPQYRIAELVDARSIVNTLKEPMTKQELLVLSNGIRCGSYFAGGKRRGASAIGELTRILDSATDPDVVAELADLLGTLGGLATGRSKQRVSDSLWRVLEGWKFSGAEWDHALINLIESATELAGERPLDLAVDRIRLLSTGGLESLAMRACYSPALADIEDELKTRSSIKSEDQYRGCCTDW